MIGSLENPDVVVRKRVDADSGRVFRLFALETVAAEDWAERDCVGKKRFFRSVVIEKAEAKEYAEKARKSGLVLTTLFREAEL